MATKTMKAINSSAAAAAPHRRKRGTSTRTPLTVSAIPNSSAAARLSDSGTLACAIRTAAAWGSVIFQMPDTRNKRPSRMAEPQLSMVFQPGRSSGIAQAPPPGCAILSVMVPIVALSKLGQGRAGTAA